MKTSRWRLNDENIGQMNVDGVLLVSGRFERVSELPGNLLYGLQVEVNQDPPDPLGVGTSKNVLDVFWMDDMISWLPKKGGRFGRFGEILVEPRISGLQHNRKYY
ncbi:hypothetical protein F2Q70_00021206 [Brassica cretica]|uniref:Uncharacterized protein n=1 Tax=Brassica cretica TaxID=69181 RepID=A0A8S9HRD0_BRACR|nr:hypothetical protein F2Q70_00021206 [Brassica cretica]KAF2559362.1 hypothetical protein F2Q68_00014670 [Brassica cretica]